MSEHHHTFTLPSPFDPNDIYPGKYRYVNAWTDSFIKFSLIDEDVALSSTSSSPPNINPSTTSTISNNSTEISSNLNPSFTTTTSSITPMNLNWLRMEGLKLTLKTKGIPTNSFQQEKYIPYAELMEEGGFEQQSSTDNPSYLNSLRFNGEGLSNITFLYRKMSSLKQMISSTILSQNYDTYFGSLEKKYKKIFSSIFDFRLHVYPDATLSLCSKYAYLPFIVQHEMRVSNLLMNNKGFINNSNMDRLNNNSIQIANETLLSYYGERSNVEVFQSFSPKSMITAIMGLKRVHHSKYTSVDVGGSILAHNIIPGNLTSCLRLTLRSPLSNKTSQLVLDSSLLGSLQLSFITELSRVYGLTACSQLRFNTTNRKSQVAFGIGCISPPMLKDFALKLRFDSEFGTCGMIEKKRFWNSENITLSLYLAKQDTSLSRYFGALDNISSGNTTTTTIVNNNNGGSTTTTVRRSNFFSDFKLGINMEFEF
ncbi:hypothetical protein ABK040_001643 [Willaertia magna]